MIYKNIFSIKIELEIIHFDTQIVYQTHPRLEFKIEQIWFDKNHHCQTSALF